jgi:hypothetical protein
MESSLPTVPNFLHYFVPETLVLLYRVPARRNLFPQNYLRFLQFLAPPNRAGIETTT